MKNFIKKSTAVSFLVALLLSGCSLLEGDFSGEVHTTFFINENSTDSNITYSDVTTLDAKDDKDIRDNIDKVKNWAVEKISYQIKNYQGPSDATFSGTIGFSPASSASPTITTSASGLNLSSLNNGPKQTVGLSTADFAKMASWFEKDQKIKVYMQGVLSQGPVSFDLVLYAKIKIKAGLL